MIRDNIAQIRQQISQAATRAGRDPSDITLTAVTKTVEPARIREAYDAGIRDFGENYYQEARDKLDQLPPDIRWHFIGHLQSNKARNVVGSFALIQSVDSLNLAKEIDRRAAAHGIRQPILIEVKLDPAQTKQGITIESTMQLAEQIAAMESTDLQGLMGMPPFSNDPEQSRPYFKQLRSMFDSLPQENRKVLSMGMTADFQIAIEEGAIMVRVGTAIFGQRS